MPGIMWYFVIALIVILAVILAVPGDGAETPPAAAAIQFPQP
jgi:hypothetical protein